MEEERIDVFEGEVVDETMDETEVCEGKSNKSSKVGVALVAAGVVAGGVAIYKKAIAPHFTVDAKIARAEKKLEKLEQKRNESIDEATSDLDPADKKGFTKIFTKKKNVVIEED